MSIDLHVHSLFSDGTYTPHELVRMAKKHRLTALSITDHDTLSGVDEAMAAATKYGVEVISGIEMSVYHSGVQMHILGYFIDHKSEELQHKISRLQVARTVRNEKILAKLNGLGLQINKNEVDAVSRVGQTGRPHIAKVLFNKGCVRNMNDAFDKFLKKGASAYESRFVYSAEEAIGIIKNAGGLSVLAHPLQVDSTLVGLPQIVDELVSLGLDGLELYYPTHSKKTRKKIRKITRKHDLLFTGGSDYHGEIRPGTSLAGNLKLYVPPELLDKMKQRWIMK